MKFLSPLQKIKEHYSWTQLRYFFFCPVFLHFCFFGFLLCPVFLGGLFLRGMKKNKIQNRTTKKMKKEEGPQDANKKTT